jgi:DNA-binding MarR family transcriptional regulator
MGMQPKDYDEILVALRRITRAIDLQSKRLLKTTGLTTSQLLVLQVIDDLGSPTPSSISREVVLSQATVTSLIDRLERNGMVSRFKSASDKRAVNIRLTPLAEEKLKDAPELLQAGFLREYRKLPEYQKHLLIGSLQQIAAMMDAEEIDASPILDTGDLNPPLQR